MSTVKNLLAGLGGAVALNILHESLKNTGENMPRVDIVGKEAIQKSLHAAGTEISDPDKLYNTTLAADLISNAVYYSAIGAGGPKNVWAKAVALGIAGGVGAVTLPKPLGLNPRPVARNTQVSALTVGYYLFGALVTGCLVKVLNRQ